jgi:hypothetical protein
VLGCLVVLKTAQHNLSLATFDLIGHLKLALDTLSIVGCSTKGQIKPKAD